MAKKVIGTLKDYITLDDAAMTLARMRMRRTVRNASKEFLLRFFATGTASKNKSRARDYLPPRRQWARPGPRSRGKKNTGQLQVASIMRCIRAHEKFGTLEATEWGGRLVRLVADVQRRVGECDISIRPPRAGRVPKLTVTGRRETREISIFDDPADAVLLARTAAYLRDWFEPVLKADRCCYSFRKSRKLTHQSAVGALCRWRMRREGEELFVAECDPLSWAAEQLLRLSAEARTSGARPPPGGKVAVFGVVKMSCKISPRAASIKCKGETR